MDLLCRLANGELVLVEMQVVPQDYWDKRTLAYAGHVYSRQLCAGGKWSDLKRVICLNILGGGKENKRHWAREGDFKRHYRFQDESGHFDDGIEVIQYSILNAPEILSRTMSDWITFLHHSHTMTQDEVQRCIETESVILAFHLAKISSLPHQVTFSASFS